MYTLSSHSLILLLVSTGKYSVLNGAKVEDLRPKVCGAYVLRYMISPSDALLGQ